MSETECVVLEPRVAQRTWRHDGLGVVHVERSHVANCEAVAAVHVWQGNGRLDNSCATCPGEHTRKRTQKTVAARVRSTRGYSKPPRAPGSAATFASCLTAGKKPPTSPRDTNCSSSSNISC